MRRRAGCSGAAATGARSSRRLAQATGTESRQTVRSLCGLARSGPSYASARCTGVFAHTTSIDCPWNPELQSVVNAETSQNVGMAASGATMSERPTLSVVDDDAETREFLRALAESDGLAVRSYSDAATCLREFMGTEASCLIVVIVDAHLESMSGLELQRELATRKLGAPVIVTTGRGDVSTAVEAMKAGAFDVLERPLAAERVLTCVRRAIAAGRTARGADEECRDIERRYASLSSREREVLHLVVSGLTSRAIAARLNLQKRTVEAYRSHINNKMQARNVADLVRMVQWIS